MLRENFIRSLEDLCYYAADRGITVVIEPLNRYEAFAGVASTIEETLSLIDELGVSNLGIQPDVFHMNMGEASILAGLRAAGDHIKHMHMNETNHCAFGTGHADFHAIMRTLKQLGYRGYVAVYLPFTSQDVWQGTGERSGLTQVLRGPLDYLKQIETAVDLQREMYSLL